MTYDKIILGAGLYGLYAAQKCGAAGQRVLVLERDPAPFMRATYINQARVHMGYHYPRSYSTAIKSAHYFERFCNDLHRIFCRTVIKLYVQYVHFFIHLPHPFHFLGFCGQAIISNIQCFFNKRCKIFTFFKICNIIVNSQSHSSWIFLK